MTPETLADDKLEGAEAIATYLGWPRTKVFRARERKWSVPIRRREMGLYAFKSELDAWLKAEDTLPNHAA